MPYDKTAHIQRHTLRLSHHCYHPGLLVSRIGGEPMMHYIKQHETLNVVFVDDSNADILLRQVVAENKKARRVLANKHVAIGLRHFVVEEKHGFNPVLHCWCGAEDASIELDYITNGIDPMTAMLSDFVNAHAECKAQGMDA